MTSPSTGNEVANQIIVTVDGIDTFVSYGVNIAQRGDGKILLDADKWDYSRTTLKYLAQFLREDGKKAIQSRIDSGRYELVELN